jgi:hypothetical protein
VKSFAVERNFINLLKIPLIFFKTAYVPFSILFVSFFLAPMALFDKKQRKIILLFLWLILVLLTLWFFMVSHQTRFLLPTLILVVILSSVALIDFGNLFKKSALPLLILLLLICNHLNPEETRQSFKSFYLDNLRAREVALASGRISKTEYMVFYIGNVAAVTEYINQNYKDKNFYNFWDKNASFYITNGNHYISNPEQDDFNKIQYLVVDEDFKNKMIRANGLNAWATQYEAESRFVQNAQVVFSYNNCYLYERIKN